MDFRAIKHWVVALAISVTATEGLLTMLWRVSFMGRQFSSYNYFRVVLDFIVGGAMLVTAYATMALWKRDSDNGEEKKEMLQTCK